MFCGSLDGREAGERMDTCIFMARSHHHSAEIVITLLIHYMCTQSCPTLCDTMAPLSMGFLRQEYWSGLPLPTPGGLPDPRIKPMSPALAGGFFTIMPFGSSCLKSVGNLPLAFLVCTETFDDDLDSGDRLMIGDRSY